MVLPREAGDGDFDEAIKALQDTGAAAHEAYEGLRRRVLMAAGAIEELVELGAAAAREAGAPMDSPALMSAKTTLEKCAELVRKAVEFGEKEVPDGPAEN